MLSVSLTQKASLFQYDNFRAYPAYLVDYQVQYDNIIPLPGGGGGGGVMPPPNIPQPRRHPFYWLRNIVPWGIFLVSCCIAVGMLMNPSTEEDVLCTDPQLLIIHSDQPYSYEHTWEYAQSVCNAAGGHLTGAATVAAVAANLRTNDTAWWASDSTGSCVAVESDGTQTGDCSEYARRPFVCEVCQIGSWRTARASWAQAATVHPALEVSGSCSFDGIYLLQPSSRSPSSYAEGNLRFAQGRFELVQTSYNSWDLQTAQSSVSGRRRRSSYVQPIRVDPGHTLISETCPYSYDTQQWRAGYSVVSLQPIDPSAEQCDDLSSLVATAKVREAAAIDALWASTQCADQEQISPPSANAAPNATAGDDLTTNVSSPATNATAGVDIAVTTSATSAMNGTAVVDGAVAANATGDGLGGSATAVLTFDVLEQQWKCRSGVCVSRCEYDCAPEPIVADEYEEMSDTEETVLAIVVVLMLGVAWMCFPGHNGPGQWPPFPFRDRRTPCTFVC